MGGAGFLVIIIAFGFLYFVLIRPQKKRQLASQRMLNELHVGDEVVTAGGIYGEIVSLGEDDVSVRIAPELDVRVARARDRERDHACDRARRARDARRARGDRPYTGYLRPGYPLRGR